MVKPDERTGAELIAAERQRQIDVEGWTPEHDDQYEYEELPLAAMCYIEAKSAQSPCNGRLWPWDLNWWKPKNRISNLVKAGALIAAEIDRLQRKTAGGGSAEVEARAINRRWNTCASVKPKPPAL